jgi:hypothetical protein
VIAFVTFREGLSCDDERATFDRVQGKGTGAKANEPAVGVQIQKP